MLILSIRRTIMHERVHGSRKGQAAGCSLGKEAVVQMGLVAMVNVTLIGFRLRGEE
jgi:hypothetical protein